MKWALVLSGGGALGLAHLGVIKVLERENLIPDMIVGTSMGAIVGAMWATGHSSAEMEIIARDFNIFTFLDGVTYKIPFSNTLTRFLQAEEAFGNMLTRRGINNGLKIRSFLDKMYEQKTFQDTKIPFYCNAVDLLTGHEMILNDGPLSDGVYASMAYPGFFEPLETPASLLCDGSVQNNYPVWIARQFGMRKVIGVNVGNYRKVPSGEIDNGLSVIFRSFVTACQTQKRTYRDRAGLTLHLPSEATSFDFEEVHRFIARGEEAAQSCLRQIRTTLYSPVTRRRTITL